MPGAGREVDARPRGRVFAHVEVPNESADVVARQGQQTLEEASMKPSMWTVTAVAACALVLASAAWRVHAQSDPHNVSKTLDEIGRILQTGGQAQAQTVAARLRELGARHLSDDDQSTWIRLARTAAIRLGDIAWLRELSTVEDAFSLDLIYTVLLADGQLLQADLEGAARTLDRAEQFTPINIRENRRIWALRARIAELNHDPNTERVYIDRIIDHLGDWRSPLCQSCHGPVTEPKTLASLPINRLWTGERYVELLQQQQDAAAVRKTAEDRLAVNPADDDARIHLAFALRAQGDHDGAEAEFKKLEWADYPDRPLAKPRMMTSFP